MPENMNQHKISAVYLRKFSYKKEDGFQYISVLNKENGEVTNELVTTFTTEDNIFDFSFNDLKENRIIENNFSEIEKHFNTLVNVIEHQKQIIPEYHEILVQFTCRLIVGAERNREFFKELYEDKNLQQGFLEEIGMFEEEIIKNDIIEIFSLLDILNLDYLNGISYLLMNFLDKVLSSFEILFIKCPGCFWLTSDNPVIIDNQEEFAYLIPLESEIYLPLSRDVCMFMFHEHSTKKDNPLRSLKKNKINIVNNELYLNLLEKFFMYNSKYIIFPYEYEKQTFNN